MNVLLYGRSAVHRGVGPDTYSSQLIGALAGKCTIGEYTSGISPSGDWDVLHVLDMKDVSRKQLPDKGLPVVMDVHDTYWMEEVGYPSPDRLVRKWLNRKRRKLYPVLLDNAARIVVHSHYVYKVLRQGFSGDHKDKVIYVPYSITLPEVSSESANINSSRILFAGRDFFRKGFPTLIEAFRLLLGRMPQAELAVVGQEYAHSLRWAKRKCRNLPVKFLGGLSRSDLHKQIIQSALVVLPSYTEAFGIVLIEAQGLGVPVNGTNIGGIPETMVDGQTGMLVPPYDAGELAGAMETLLKDPGRRCNMGKEGIEWVRRKYSNQKMAEAMMTAYHGAVDAVTSET